MVITEQAERTLPNDDVREALQLVRRGLEQRAEQGLTAVLEAGFRALFTKSMRETVEREVEHILREGITRALGAAPDGAVTTEVESQIEHVVQAVLPEILDNVLSGPIGAEIERHGQRAIEAMVRKDFEAAQGDSREALAEALDGTLQIMRHHKRDVLVAIVRVLTTVSDQLVTEKLVESQHIAGNSGGTLGKRVSPRQETVRDSAGLRNGHGESPDEPAAGKREQGTKPVNERGDHTGDELRDQFRRAGQTLRHQIAKETEGLQERLGQEFKSAAKSGRRPGRPPSVGRSSLGHPPSRTAPPGRPPSTRRSPR